jgi:hypothetical protein
MIIPFSQDRLWWFFHRLELELGTGQANQLKLKQNYYKKGPK